jgi:hypothetical protein
MQRKEGAYLPCLLVLKQKKRKKNTRENKTIGKNKICKERKELTFFSLTFTFVEALLLPSPFHVPSMLNSPPSSWME